MPKKTMTEIAISVFLFWTMTFSAQAQDTQEIQVTTQDLGKGAYVLFGEGGNIGLSVGDDGILMIDDQWARMSEKILAALLELSDKKPRYVINTHWHPDHVGSNESMADNGAIIIAHESVRERMSTSQVIDAFKATVEPSPDKALPKFTFSDTATFHFNEDEIAVIHVDPAHTDGDSIVYIRGANVLHMGDTFINGMLPFFDYSTGGHLGGAITALETGLRFADDDTDIIPGHGPMAKRADMQKTHDGLKAIHERLTALVAEGKSDEEIIASMPLEEIDHGMSPAFLTVEQFLTVTLAGMRMHEGS